MKVPSQMYMHWILTTAFSPPLIASIKECLKFCRDDDKIDNYICNLCTLGNVFTSMPTLRFMVKGYQPKMVHINAIP